MPANSWTREEFAAVAAQTIEATPDMPPAVPAEPVAVEEEESGRQARLPMRGMSWLALSTVRR